MRTRTEGHRLLAQWSAEDPKRTRAWIASKLDITASAVTQWRTKNAVPDRVSQIGLKLLAGIHEDSWLSRTEIKRRDRIVTTLRDRAA
jgi:hypothetical protein